MSGRSHSNGRAARAGGNEPIVVQVDDLDDEPIAGLGDVDWRQSYDRESVDRYLAAVEVEKARLLAEIRVAEERAAAAQQRQRVSTTERDARLGALVLAARDEIERIDAEHRATVAALRVQAEEEAARIRDRAQADAAAVREVVASMTATAAQGGSSEGDETASPGSGAVEPVSQEPRHAG